MSLFAPKKTDATESFFRAFCVDARVKADGYTAVGFGDSEAMADALLELVILGVKRATTSLLRDFADGKDPLPKAGDYSVIVDGRNKPRCVMKTTQVRVGPLSSVDDVFARTEGEGDRTRASWLRDHTAYFTRQAEREGFSMSDDMPAVFERFTIVWPRLMADGPKRLTL